MGMLPPAGREEESDVRAPGQRPARIRLWLLLVAVGFLVVAVIGFVSRQLQFKKLQETTKTLDEEFVETTRPQKVPATVTLNLPGETEALR